ncbi:hypothetical protein BH10PSE6_BH10PSE6_19470 [soil metagenome]
MKWLTTSAVWIAIWAALAMSGVARAQTDPLPSWNEGAAKAAIVDFVRTVTAEGTPGFVRAEARIATFDQDGTLLVEHPTYIQLMFCLDRLPLLTGTRALVRYLPGLMDLRAGNPDALADLSKLDIDAIAMATRSGMSTDVYADEVKKCLATATDLRWKRPYTDSPTSRCRRC